jgi:acetyl esterase/lipase
MKGDKFYLLSVLCLMLASCTSASLFVVNTLAKWDDYRVHKNIPYAAHSLNHLDIYIPEKQMDADVKTYPVLIFFYGGCWGGCTSRTKEDYEFVAQALTAQGYVVVITDYRRYPEVKFESIINDAANSVEWVKNNISQYAGKDDQLFLMGHSAGAHLAAMLTFNEHYLTKDSYQSITGFIGLAGPYDFLPLTKPYQTVVFGPEHKYAASQPINFVDGSEPPSLLLYGKQDRTVYPRSIKNLAAKINQQGGKVEVHLYEDIDHYSILAALSIPYQNQLAILNDIIGFIQHHSGSSIIQNKKFNVK